MSRRALFATQGMSARAFAQVATRLEKDYGWNSSAFVVSDRRWNEEFCQSSPSFNQARRLEEWKISGMQSTPEDRHAIEARLGVSLWRVALSDRRLMTGWYSSFQQDYKLRTHPQVLLGKVVEGALQMRAFFDETRPEVVVGFVCVTYIEYLAYLEAKARRIPVRNLRPARIANLVVLDDGIFDPPSALVAAMKRPPKDLKASREIIHSIRSKAFSYEGVAKEKRESTPRKRSPIQELKSRVRDYFEPVTKRETHRSRPYRPIFGSLKPAWNRWRNSHLNALTRDQIAEVPSVFFPMHLEPELALLLYAPAYQNQIEVIRTLALALPSTHRLIIKDHPLGHRRRSHRYYQKLLSIPNVRLVDPKVDSRECIEASDMVALIGGSIGLEGLVRKKPVLVLGPHTTYRFIENPRMLRFVTDLNRLDMEIRIFLREASHDESTLERFIQAIVDSSFPLNLYSDFLGRKDVVSFQSESDPFQLVAQKIVMSLENEISKTSPLHL